MALEPSILISVKKVLGLDKEYDVFDQDILMHINSAFFSLHQLGVGSGPNSFVVETEESKWEDFFQGNDNLHPVKSYVFLKVRLLFDPPSTSFAIDSFQKQISELEWRLNVSEDVVPVTVEEVEA